MNTYKNITAKGSGKNASRNIQEQYIALSKVDAKGDFLTMPNVDWTMERMLIENLDAEFKFIAVERDTNTFDQMKKVAKKNNINHTLHECKLSDMIIGMAKDRYSHMCCDYCGTIQTSYPELKYALNNKLVKKGGSIFYTSNERIIGKPGTRLEAEFIKGFPKRKGITRYQHMVECFIKREGGSNFVVDQVYKYTDPKAEKKGANMILFVITRVK